MSKREERRKRVAERLGVEPSNVALTISELAEEYDLRRQSVGEWRGKPGFPQPDGPPFVRSECRRWYHANIAGQSNAKEADVVLARRSRRLDLILKAERIRSVKLKREIESGQLMRRDFGNKVICDSITEYRRELEDMIGSLPSQVERKDAQSIRSALEKWYDAFCDRMCHWIDAIDWTAGLPTVAQADYRAKDVKRQNAANHRHKKGQRT